MSTSISLTLPVMNQRSAAGIYTYSSRELLASGDGLSYVYDGNGHRVSATSSAGTRVSLYDDALHLQSESGLTTGAIPTTTSRLEVMAMQ
jgi:YD repeat-containing protein